MTFFQVSALECACDFFLISVCTVTIGGGDCDAFPFRIIFCAGIVGRDQFDISQEHVAAGEEKDLAIIHTHIFSDCDIIKTNKFILKQLH